MPNKTKIINSLWIALFLAFSLFVWINPRSCSRNTGIIDTLSSKVHTEQQIMRDTVWKYDTVKLKADVIYKTKHDTLWTLKPSDVDSMFNVVYPRDSVDTTNYSTGYTQLRKAIDTHNKSIRDSIKEQASVEQVKACTTTVTKIVNQIDTAKTTIQEPSKTNWKSIGIIAIISLLLGGLGGFAAH